MPKRKAPPQAWKPGQSGNPDGRKAEKLIKDQLALILSEEVEIKRTDENGQEYVKKIRRLRLLAENVVNCAIAGSAQHAALVFDRVDGKVPQAHDIKQQTTVTIHAEAVSDFDRWVTGIAAREANGADSDVGSERSVLSDTVPPKPTRH